MRRKKVRAKKALPANNYISVLLSDCPEYIKQALERHWGWEDMLKLKQLPVSWAIEHLKGGTMYKIVVKIDGKPQFDYTYDGNPKEDWSFYLKVILDSIMSIMTKEEIEPYKKVIVNVLRKDENIHSQTLCLTPDFEFKIWGNTR